MLQDAEHLLFGPGKLLEYVGSELVDKHSKSRQLGTCRKPHLDCHDCK